MTTTQVGFHKERKIVNIFITNLFYRFILKPILFKIDPEFVHTRVTHTAELIGKNSLARLILQTAYVYKDKALEQKIVGINFKNPVGLSAGFDYEARLTQILPNLGFGFETVGTITNQPNAGNPQPILGRLPKSQSLMVNKGFKNLGAKQTIENLSGLSFQIPVGISIGRTNIRKPITLKQSIEDIIQAFKSFEQSKLKHEYYELNISCPNLYNHITFYPSNNLRTLLAEIDKLRITKPIFVKMPIEKTDKETLAMLQIIAKYSPKGVIFGNLQKNRSHPVLDQREVSRFPQGNFSGKPTYERSNKLIQLSYKQFHKRFIIIGTGGIFSAEDAYTKITLGASLVQLITGMIFVGPQLIADINIKLVDLLKKDGFKHISEAIGSRNM